MAPTPVPSPMLCLPRNTDRNLGSMRPSLEYSVLLAGYWSVTKQSTWRQIPRIGAGGTPIFTARATATRPGRAVRRGTTPRVGMRSFRPFARLTNSAIVIALLFALQGLFLVAPLGGYTRQDIDAQRGYSTSSRHCDKAPEPAQNPCKHSPCCVLCKVNGNCDDLRNLARPFSEPLGSAQRSNVTGLSPRAPEQPVFGPVGWTSAWSSRAPPLFS